MPEVFMRRLVAELEAACSARTIANGAKTDIGQRVVVNRQNLQAAEMPAVTIAPGEATALSERADTVTFERIVTLEASAVRDVEDPLMPEDMLHDLWVAVHAAREKLKQANGFRHLSVNRLDIPQRDEGNTVVGATVDVNVRFIAQCDTLE